MKKFYIVDAANLLFRSYYAIKNMTNEQGQSTNALFGFIRSILKLIKDFQPEYLTVVFDGPDNKRSRKALYEHYKIHRKGMPDDLYPQVEWAAQFCELLGIRVYTIEGVEADDTMGTLAKWIEKRKGQAYLCSSDKDLCQLVSDHIFVINLSKDSLLIDQEKVKELFGIQPHQMIDYLALTGDASDNIPGVEGIGPKGAIELLQKYDSLEKVLLHAHEIPGKKGETLKNSKEIALLSYKLATIHTDLDFEKKEEDLKLQQSDKEKLKAFYQEMHFLSLLKELGENPSTPTHKDIPKEYHTITTMQQLEALEKQLRSYKEVVLDTETTSTSPQLAELVGVSFSAKTGEAWYIPLNGPLERSGLIKALKKLIENPHLEWIGHNIKYDKHILLNEDIHLNRIGFDTMIASYLLNPHHQRHNLDTLSLEVFSKVKIPIEEVIGKGKNQITMKEAPIEQVAQYSCEDADYTLRLKDHFEKDLHKKHLFSIFKDMEMPLLNVLFKMERRGIYVDLAYLKELSQEFSLQIHQLEKVIYKEAKEEFNINSPKQLSHILFDKMGIKPPRKTATGYSTAADVLEQLQEEVPFVQKILEYRSLDKLKTTFVDALIQQVFSLTGRIHCTFNQSVAATGRLSSQDPNLQNIPVRTVEGKKVRKAFKPQDKGWSFLSADYSQIELRLLAHMSEDPLLLKAFRANEDIHVFTASQVFDIPLEEVTPEMRQKAKAVNFGILYGQQAFGLSQGLALNFHEAKKFIDRYFERYKRVKEFLESCKEFARKHGYSQTLTGRQRPIPEINSKNAAIRSAAERLAINSPLQGTNADIIKMAMITIDKELKNTPSYDGDLLIQIHDELLFESPDDQLEPLGHMVKKHMEGVIPLKVPLVVDISIGKNWAEC